MEALSFQQIRRIMYYWLDNKKLDWNQTWASTGNLCLRFFISVFHIISHICGFLGSTFKSSLSLGQGTLDEAY